MKYKTLDIEIEIEIVWRTQKHTKDDSARDNSNFSIQQYQNPMWTKAAVKYPDKNLSKMEVD